MRDLTELDDPERAAAMERFLILRPHLEHGSALWPLAQSAQLPFRTAQRWVQLYKRLGLAGLARKGRSDQGARRKVSPDGVRLIEGLALQRPPLSTMAIHRELSAWARTSGQPIPSHDTVRRIVENIAPGLMTLGKEGEKAYRDSFDLVQRREESAPNAIWQADHTELDLDARRDNGSEARPWLTVITDDYSRAVTGFAFSFEAPSTLRTALALRQAIWRKSEPHWEMCGIPQALYSDNGSDFTSDHLQQVAADLKIRLIHSTPGIPRGRGKIERFFRTVNQRFLSHLPGHRRGGHRRPGTLLTLAELDRRFREFLREYHLQPHSATKQPPGARWRADGFLPHLPESLEQLDLLLLTIPRSRVVRSDGVHFSGQRYIDSVLSAYVGERVIVRYDPRDIAEIRLFHEGRFLCRAIDPGLAGQVIPLKDIVSARNRQRREVRQQLKERQAVVDQLLVLRQGWTDVDDTADHPPSPTVPPRVKIKRYRND